MANTLGPAASRTVSPSEAVELEVDPLCISQALSNLLTNAAKYTDVGGRIVATATLDEARRLAISVADTGIGFSAPGREIGAAARPRLAHFAR